MSQQQQAENYPSLRHHRERFREGNKETRGGRKKKGRKQGNKVKRHEREASWQGRVGCAPVRAQEKKKRHGEEELRIRHLNATVMFTKCRKYKQTRAFYALSGEPSFT